MSTSCASRSGPSVSAPSRSRRPQSAASTSCSTSSRRASATSSRSRSSSSRCALLSPRLSFLPLAGRSHSSRRSQDIFRRYPHRYEGIIPTLCASLDELDEPEAKASLIWILGEYADKISNASDLIGSFLDTYADEPVQVQLQTLTAVVKLFLHRPEEAQQLVQRVLALATKTADSADLRDRAYIQWRLLSSDVEVAKVRPLSCRPRSSCAQLTRSLARSRSSSRRARLSRSLPPRSLPRFSRSSSASSAP